MSSTVSHDGDIRSTVTIKSRSVDGATPTGLDAECINAIRFLAIDSIQKSGSGHPGTPMGLAPLAWRLWSTHMRYDPSAPGWLDRDRFIMSGGHACMLQYASLYLAGYDLGIEDLKQFRQWGSRTPGHPEMDVTPGIEINTGPLGQGVANGVGMAMAERMLAARFNRDGHEIVDHHVWVTAGEGDIMEGISYEAASIAGRLKLGKLIVFYDDNEVTLEGPSPRELNENIGDVFKACQWHVVIVDDINDLNVLDKAIEEAKAEADRPSLVIVRSHIGYGSPVQDSFHAHGSPLGDENVAATRKALGWSSPPFEVPENVLGHWREASAGRAKSHADWQARWEAYASAHPDVAKELKRVMDGELPIDWNSADMPSFKPGDSVATRVAGGKVLNAFAAAVPELTGGSADVAPSTHTDIDGSSDVNSGDWTGRNIHFGVREHAMGAICNGMAAHGGIRPYCATFFSFLDYMREPVRLASLMRLPVVFIFTHDSIALGEDGPTHQPIEHLAGLRTMPVLRTYRPGDAQECIGSWREALAYEGPSCIVLTRQGLPVMDPSMADVSKGASVVADGDRATIIATGSEVGLAMAAREQLASEGIEVRVVSMPCVELFRSLSEDIQSELVPCDRPIVAVEAAAPETWYEFADDVVGLSRFGASAPGPKVYAELGFTPEHVAERVQALVGIMEGVG
ncbi:MAG: transketolase [Planctomycetota bacterium]|nr:transketolase [Planctomycetota bacterium]